jgi:hypothetical protein
LSALAGLSFESKYNLTENRTVALLKDEKYSVCPTAKLYWANKQTNKQTMYWAIALKIEWSYVKLLYDCFIKI